MKIEAFKLERRFYNAPVVIEKRDGEEESRTIKGYAAIFNSWSRYLGWFKEKVDAKAFEECDMSDVVALFNHNFDILFARSTSDTLKLGVDEKGLYYEFDAPNTSDGNNLLELVKRGDISTSSFQFVVEEDKWIEDPDEGTQRIIQKISRLIDVSPVTFAAYADSSVDVARRSYDEYQKENEEEQEEETKHLDVIHARANLEYIKIK